MRIRRRRTAVSRATLACGTCLTLAVTLPAAATVECCSCRPPLRGVAVSAVSIRHVRDEKLPRITTRSLKFSTLDFHVDYNLWFQLDRLTACECHVAISVGRIFE